MPTSTQLFSQGLRTGWALVLFVTVAVELLPLPPVPAAVLYSYVAWKAALFIALGSLTPLAFWAFDRIGFGVLFSVLTAGSVELLQSLSAGHRASVFEFVAKLVLLFIGFALALNLRYDGVLRLGPFRRQFINPHEKH